MLFSDEKREEMLITIDEEYGESFGRDGCVHLEKCEKYVDLFRGSTSYEYFMRTT